jgi:hypothetical protein
MRQSRTAEAQRNQAIIAADWRRQPPSNLRNHSPKTVAGLFGRASSARGRLRAPLISSSFHSFALSPLEMPLLAGLGFSGR